MTITILSRMKELASSIKEYEVVLAVGEILAPRIIAEIGNVTRFHSSKYLTFVSRIIAIIFHESLYI